MIERALDRTLGARSDFNLGPDDVTCRIEVPPGRRPDRMAARPA